MGSVYEFHNIKTPRFPLFSKRSSYTDDSIMTMAVAEWLLKDPAHGMDTLEKEFLSFAKNYPCPMGGYGGGFHRWLLHPEDLGGYGSQNFELGTRHPYNSWGNGSAMRCGATGWMFDTLEETERVAEISAAITHNHPEGIKGAQATAAAVWMARNGRMKENIRDYIEGKFGYDLHSTYEIWHPTYRWDSSCQGTVPQAIICFLDSDSFEDAMRKAVSLGGDSDTLAAITGSIAEAAYGIPDTIREKACSYLDDTLKDVLERWEKFLGKI